jgi:hypothetical protein
MTFNFNIFLCFSNIWNNLSNFLAIWSAYLVKFLSVDGFIIFFKLKIRVTLSNRIRSVWALTLCQSLTQILAFVASQTKQLDRAQIDGTPYIHNAIVN